MTTITFTDLQLRVTLAPWRKAQMPQWSERDWRMHLHDECVLYLNGAGKAKVFGVTIEDLADRGLTEWDKAGVEGRGESVPVPEAAATSAGNTAQEQRSAAPADPEWPKWFLNGGAPHCAGVPWEAVRHDEPGDGGHWYNRDGTSGFAAIYDDKDVNYREIPRPEALQWLRANGHAKVAEELERQAAPAPATAGLQVWRSNRTSIHIARNTSRGLLVLASRIDGKWQRERDDGPDEYLPACTRLPAAEEAREIEAAREAGVL